MSPVGGLRPIRVDADDHAPTVVIAVGRAGSAPQSIVRVTGSCALDLVDRLARLVLEVRRGGLSAAPVEIREDLHELLALMGLDELLSE